MWRHMSRSNPEAVLKTPVTKSPYTCDTVFMYRNYVITGVTAVIFLDLMVCQSICEFIVCVCAACVCGQCLVWQL